MKIRLYGQVPAQKNSKQVAYNRRTGKPFIMSSQKIKDWQANIKQQLMLQNLQTLSGPVKIDISIINQDKRPRDLDNQLSSILDSLKNNGVIEDDNYSIVRDIHISFDKISRQDCGAEIEITPINES